MYQISSFDCSRIAQDLQIRKVQVEAVVQLFDEGNTVPFITRYRKERTGGLNEEVIRQIQTRVGFLRQLAERKQTILKSLDTQGKLTEELGHAIGAADTIKRLEDLYLPYKPKKKTLASTARERGLEPLAVAIWTRDPAAAQLEELLPALVNPDKQLATVDDVRAGVQHILAEMIAETADVRAEVRVVFWETGKVRAVKSEKLGEGQGLDYKDYFDFTEPARQIPAHRILALNRGEKENALKVHVEFPPETMQQVALKALAEHLKNPRLPPQRREKPPTVDAAAAPDQPVVQATSDAPSPTEAATSTPEVPPPAAVETPPPTEPAASTPEASPPAPLETPPVTSAGIAPPAENSPAPEAPSLPVVIESPPLPLPVEVAGEPLSPGSDYATPHAALLRKVLEDSLARLLLPSLEREIRHELTDEAENHAVAVFARNLRSLLLQPPLHNRRVLAIDPGLRTGCKIAVLDEFGNLLENTVVFAFGQHQKKGPREKKGAPAPTPPTTGEAPAAPVTGEVPVAAEQTTTPVPEVAVSAAPGGEVSAAPPEPAPVASEASNAAEAAAPPVEAVGPPAEAAVPVETPPTPSEPAPQPTEAKPPEPAAAEAPPPDRKAEAKSKLRELITKHGVQIVALGNGTGCRETEEIIADLIAADFPDLAYVIVNEAGASVYSVSAYGREEFPNFDSTLRSTISIGRRLQDPLSELVKVDPPNIGVGLYQHDINRKDLRESLDGVVESCVNQVGVDLNTASVPLLRHVSGLNQLVARELVEHRQKSGPFTSREQLLQIPGLGPTRFVQAAGFLKIPGSVNPLDRTWIHPESYGLAEKILEELASSPKALEDKPALEELQGKLKSANPEELAKKLAAGIPTVVDILLSLARPGRDPREDLPPPIFKKGILKLEDLQQGMELKGTVLNVVDFGAFVDIGLKDSGLVHISQMANRYIKSPYDVAAVSDVVTVWVLGVDKDRHRVSLTMIKPGTERKPQERRPQQQRGRPPREPRPAQAGSESGAPVGAGTGGPPQQQHGQQRHGQQRQGDQRQGDQRQGDQRQGDQRQGDRRRPPPRGRGPYRPGQAPSAPATPGDTAQPASVEGGSSPPPQPARTPPPPPPPRRPRREAPKPKLSQEALDGKVPLRTFGELSVLFATKKEKKPEPAPAVVAEPEPAPTTVAEAGPPPDNQNP